MIKHLPASLIDEGEYGSVCKAERFIPLGGEADGIDSTTCLKCLDLLRAHELSVVAAIDERLGTIKGFE